MDWVRVWLMRIKSLFGRNRLERELADDIQSHLEMATNENLRQGMSADDAVAESRRQFGGVEQMKEQFRDQLSFPLFDGLCREFRLAIRSMGRRPGFAVIAILTLALGIGVNTAVFSLIDPVLIAPLPYPDAHRLATVWLDLSRVGFDRVETTPADYLDWRADSEVFEDMAAFYGNAFNLTGKGTPERLEGIHATPNLFRVLGVQPALGRWFLDSEGDPGNEAVAMLSYGLWQEQFGSDRDVVGRTLTLNGRVHEVVGVMPAGFQFPREDIRLWVPFVIPTENRSTYFLQVVGRMRREASLAEAQTEMDAIAQRLVEAYPGTNRDRDATAILPLRDQFVGDRQLSLWLLLAASGLVLLVACANVAGLITTRGITRSREIALRTALGAGRLQVARQLIVEGLTLSLTGGAVGTIFAMGTFQYLETLTPASLGGAVAPELNMRLLAFALGVSLLTGAVFGLVPLRRMFRADVSDSIGTRMIGSLRGRSGVVLVSAEIALTLVVVASTGLLVRTLQNLEAVDPGFQAENVLTARLEQFRAVDSIQNRQRFYNEVVDRIERLPGVTAAGFTTFLPYTFSGGANTFLLEDRPNLPENASVAYRREITRDFPSALGLPLLAGREFEETDNAESPPVVIVSEYIANLLGGDAVGKRLGLPQQDGPPSWMRIVGVVGEIRQEALDRPSERAVMYLPVAQSDELWFFNPRDLVIRVAGDPAALAPALRREVWAVDPDQSISNVRTLETLVEEQLSDRRTLTELFTTFSALTLFLAALGVYGLMSFVVATRAKEFGLRVALGAERRALAGAVARQGFLWLGSGILVGLAVTLAVTRSLDSILYEVQPVDAISLAASVVALCGAGIVAALIPVWRATRADPMVVLRFD